MAQFERGAWARLASPVLNLAPRFACVLSEVLYTSLII